MIVYADGRNSGTIGGGKFESLVMTDALGAIREKKPLLKTYPLHEGDVCSFGAICGGEVTIFIEPQILSEAIYLIGAGHCARAIAKLAIDCGLFVTVVDDRSELHAELPNAVEKVSSSPPEFIRAREWKPDEALVSGQPELRDRSRRVAGRAWRSWRRLHRNDWQSAQSAARFRRIA